MSSVTFLYSPPGHCDICDSLFGEYGTKWMERVQSILICKKVKKMLLESKTIKKSPIIFVLYPTGTVLRYEGLLAKEWIIKNLIMDNRGEEKTQLPASEPLRHSAPAPSLKNAPPAHLPHSAQPKKAVKSTPKRTVLSSGKTVLDLDSPEVAKGECSSEVCSLEKPSKKVTFAEEGKTEERTESTAEHFSGITPLDDDTPLPPLGKPISRSTAGNNLSQGEGHAGMLSSLPNFSVDPQPKGNTKHDPVKTYARKMAEEREEELKKEMELGQRRMNGEE